MQCPSFDCPQGSYIPIPETIQATDPRPHPLPLKQRPCPHEAMASSGQSLFIPYKTQGKSGLSSVLATSQNRRCCSVAVEGNASFGPWALPPTRVPSIIYTRDFQGDKAAQKRVTCPSIKRNDYMLLFMSKTLIWKARLPTAGPPDNNFLGTTSRRLYDLWI